MTFERSSMSKHIPLLCILYNLVYIWWDYLLWVLPWVAFPGSKALFGPNLWVRIFRDYFSFFKKREKAIVRVTYVDKSLTAQFYHFIWFHISPFIIGHSLENIWISESDLYLSNDSFNSLCLTVSASPKPPSFVW